MLITLTAVRMEKGYSQTALAKKLGIFQPELSMFENMKMPIPEKLEEPLTEILGVPSKYLQRPYKEYLKSVK